MIFRDSKDTRTYQRRSLHGQLVHQLGVRIVSGEIAEGALLSTEERASADLAVSRTAYREAIKILSAKGLVESRPKVGTRVRARSRWNMLDPDVLLWASEQETIYDFVDTLFEFRMIVEPGAARLAAEKARPEEIGAIQRAMKEMAATEPGTQENVNADVAFHEAILTATDNALLGSLTYVVDALLARSFEVSSRRPVVRAASLPLHQAVCDHIVAGDGAAAAAAMTALLTSARKDIDEIMKSDRTKTRPG